MTDSPPILRPIPLRPNHPNGILSTETISSPPSPSPDISYRDLPNPHDQSTDGIETPSYLRTASSINLTSSTLFGIYGSTEPETPSTLSSCRQSPVPSLGRSSRRPPPLNTTSAVENSRLSSIILHRRLSSQQQVSKKSIRSSAKTTGREKAWQFTWRVALLFAIGVCYGLIVFHLQNEGARNMKGMYVENIIRNTRAEEAYNWNYLALWGVAGVGLGSLLPWIDGLWEETRSDFGNDVDGKEDGDSKGFGAACLKNTSGLAADWNPMVRSIGVFVGIAFAIRKLAWTSTLQLSLTLALVNPFLWYLVDRSLPGFTLSLLTGTIGTFLLLALNPSMIPPPLSLSTSASSPSNNSPSYATSIPSIINGTYSGIWDWRMVVSREGLLKAGVMDYVQLLEIAEIAIWIGSVLFCSVVCFGGVGRRLALGRPA